MNKLESLKALTTIVADTGDIESIKKWAPTDATTNPSLILKAAQMTQYHHLVDEAIAHSKENSVDCRGARALLLDKLTVNFGCEILKIIPGRVSTEVDARLSFDTEGSIAKAKALIALYNNAGIEKERILIKLASTWEGICAAERLEKEGIHCNMTLMFSIAQAVACAEAKATLISPFVGRILDWYKKAESVNGYPADKDPGVLSVGQIFNYYKKFGYTTQVMGASFRNADEILELAGCDLLTIAPDLLQELQSRDGEVVRKLDATTAQAQEIDKIDIDETTFRWMVNDDAMATEKLAEGIRNFAYDTVRLEQYIRDNFVREKETAQ